MRVTRSSVPTEGWAGTALALVFSFAVGVLLIATTQEAMAVPPSSCPEGFGYNEEAKQGLNQANHRGNRADIYSYPYDDDCQRILGVTVVGASGGFVEYSWILGWSNCSGQYYGVHATFAWWRPAGGTDHCRMLSSIPATQWDRFSISDTGGDTVWTAARNGNDVTTVNVNFTHGTAVVLRERGRRGDNGFAVFQDAGFNREGSGWLDWTDPQESYETDDWYTQEYPSNNRVRVVHV